MESAVLKRLWFPSWHHPRGRISSQGDLLMFERAMPPGVVTSLGPGAKVLWAYGGGKIWIS